MSDHWDVIVAGAGPAGSALAIRLAEAGARVLLVDRAEFPRDKLCGEFLSPECWPMLDALGVGESVRDSGYQPIRRLRLWTSAGSCVESSMQQRPDRPAIGLSRARLDQILVRRAAEVGTVVMENVQVVELVEHAGTVIGVHARPIAGQSGSRGVQRLFARVIVAADGRRSTVVRASGHTTRSRRCTPANVCAVKRHYRVAGPNAPGDAIELHSFPGGYGGTCGVEAGVVNLCTLLPIALLRRSRGRIERALRAVTKKNRLADLLDDAEPLSDWKTIPDVHVQRSRPTVAGVLYVGDAIGTVDPLGGEGMAMAIEGAFVAARFVLRALESRCGCDRALQRGYEAAWNGRFNQRIRLCRAFSWLLARPAVLRTLLPPFVGNTWSHTLLPLAFRATRGSVESTDLFPAPVVSKLALSNDSPSRRTLMEAQR